MARFVILAVPRTGSNLLCTLLNSHPEILCHHEVFNPQGVFTALTHRDMATEIGSPQERDRDPLGFLQRLWQTWHNHRCIGFKWTHGQNEVVLRNVLEDSGIKKIVLRRRNRIKTYVSEKIARKTQQWEVYHEQELVMPRPRVTVEMADLNKHIAQNRHFYDEIASSLERLEQPHINVVFEKLLTSGEQMRILEFLGLHADQQQLRPASVKQNSMNLRDSIENFAQLSMNLQNSDLYEELHDRGI